MQTVQTTPAESLLQRLLLTKKLDCNYYLRIERNDSHTNIYVYKNNGSTIGSPCLLVS
jgi:hypothetical protein